MSTEDVSLIAKAIKNQMQRIDDIIGPQKWYISKYGDEIYGVLTSLLSENLIERLEQSRIDGIFGQDTFYQIEDFHIDALLDSHYWIGIYSYKEEVSLSSQQLHLLSTLLGNPIEQ